MTLVEIGMLLAGAVPTGAYLLRRIARFEREGRLLYRPGMPVGMYLGRASREDWPETQD